jgi:hypothetical protein
MPISKIIQCAEVGYIYFTLRHDTNTVFGLDSEFCFCWFAEGGNERLIARYLAILSMTRILGHKSSPFWLGFAERDKVGMYIGRVT